MTTYGEQVEAVVLDGIKQSGFNGASYPELLKKLLAHPSGLVDVEVGRSWVAEKYTEWDEVPGYEYYEEPVYEAQSVYDTDDLNEALIDLDRRGLVRFDKALKTWRLTGAA